LANRQGVGKVDLDVGVVGAIVETNVFELNSVGLAKKWQPMTIR